MNNPKIILLIEDNPLLAEMYRTAFSKKGFDVAVANDGPAGLAMLKDKNPGLVLLDILMPGMDGLVVLQKIKEDPATKDVRVVMMTVVDSKDYEIKARKLGALDYIRKNEMELNDIVEKVSALSQ